MGMIKTIRASRTGHASDEDRKLVTLDLKGGPKTFALQNIPRSLIVPDPNQPRKTFPPAELNELADDIKTRGLLQPIGLRPDGNGGYIIVFGERRFRATGILDWEEIPAIVMDLQDAALILEAQIVENIHREDFELLEIATAFAKLVEMVGTAAEAARRLSISPSLASQYMAIATTNIEDILKLVSDGYTSDARAVYELTKIGKADPVALQKTIAAIRDGAGGDNIRALVSDVSQTIAQAAGRNGKAETKKPSKHAKKTKTEPIQRRPSGIHFEEHPNQDLVYLLSIDEGTPMILDYNVAKQLFEQLSKHF